MEDYDECPEWFGKFVFYCPEWDSMQNKPLALHKWGIDSSKDNSIDAAYNSVAEEIMHSFEDGLSSIGVYDYEADLELLRKIKLLMDEKIEDRDCKSIKGRLMGLRKSFMKDFKDCFDVIDPSETDESLERSKQTESRPERRRRLLEQKIVTTYSDPLNIPDGEIIDIYWDWYKNEFNVSDSTFQKDLGALRKKGVYSSEKKTRG